MTRIILVAFDGLRPDMVSAEATPHLAELAMRGTRFANARSVFPSERRAATPSVTTGCRPGAHGMVANTLFDARVAPDRLLRTKLVADLRTLADGRESPMERPSLSEHLAAAGRRFALVSAGTQGAAHLLHPAATPLDSFCWNVEDFEGDIAARVRERFGATPPHGVPNTARVTHAGRVLLEMVLPEIKPDVALIWLSEPDVSFHWGGLRCAHAQQALREADALLGRILAWRDAQPDAAEIVIMVLSDHGHVTGVGKRSLVVELHRAGFRAGTGMAADVGVVIAPGAADRRVSRHAGLGGPAPGARPCAPAAAHGLPTRSAWFGASAQRRSGADLCWQ